VTGYSLTYGSLFLDTPGLDEVAMIVDGYKTTRAARRALKQQRKEYLGGSSYVKNLTQLNLTATEASLAVPAVGDSRFGALLTLSVPTYGSVYLVDEEIRDGKYILQLTVAAGSQDLATSYAAAKARLFDRRLHLGLNGRLHGRSVRIPKLRKQGPPKSGLDPATAALQTSDLPGSQIDFGGYDGFTGAGALSSYTRNFQPAAPFDIVSQIVSVMPSTNGAAFTSALLGAELIAFGLSNAGSGSTTQVTPVDVSAVGDEAQAAIVSVSGSGPMRDVAVVTLHSGAVADIVIAESAATIDPSAVQSLAHAAADRLDAALP
jgi:hypothetical protein